MLGITVHGERMFVVPGKISLEFTETFPENVTVKREAFPLSQLEKSKSSVSAYSRW